MSVNDPRDCSGPAFPVPNTEWQSPGMMLRDYFAAKALPEAYAAAVIECEHRGWPEDWRMGVALDAYLMADAMLKARQQ